MTLIDADALIKYIDMGHLRSPYEKSFSDSEVVDMLEAAPTANPYKIVLEALKEVPMFTGKYDAKNGNIHFMYGISTVLEYIADKAGDEEYIDMFLDNMNKSVYGDKAE